MKILRVLLLIRYNSLRYIEPFMHLVNLVRVNVRKKGYLKK